MEVNKCQRCGRGFVELDAPQGGRPRRWCSENCRRRAHEERRAARSAKPPDPTAPPAARSPDGSARRRRRRAALSPQPEGPSATRERPTVKSVAQPLTREAAISRILDDTEATTELLHQLASRARDDSEPAAVKQWRARQHRSPIEELYDAYHRDTDKPPQPTPHDSDAQAVLDEVNRTGRTLEEVLASPELTAGVLDSIFRRALTGRLDDPTLKPVKTVLDEILRTLAPPQYIDPIKNIERRQQNPPG